MPNSLDFDGRGPSDHQLLAMGATVLLIAGLITGALLLKSTGKLNDYVRVVAELTNVGDGLPARSDVKYHGLLVGAVDNVVPAAYGKPNYVQINLKPEYAKDIPGAVTARVVPSNVFAVSSVQLVDGGPGSSIRSGARIPEDQQLSTVIFQTTISKLRDILAATGRGREDHSVGLLAAVAAATNNRRSALLTAGAQLTRVLDELNSIVATDPGPTTVSALLDATRGLQSTAPELVDVLHDAVKPMQTLAEKREQFRSLVTGSHHTIGVNRQAFDNHTDQLIEMTQNLTPVLGVFALHSDKFVPIFTRLNRLSDKFFEEVWDPELDTGNMRVNLALTPSYTYTRADCPRYGQLLGPSCYTAPTIAVRPDLPEVLLPQNYHPPADLAPPPGTQVGPDGNLVPVGPPLYNPNPSLQDPNPPLPWWPWPIGPAPRVPGTADPDDAPPPPPGPNPGPPGAVAPSGFGGNVGPVGSQHERDQLGLITGQGHSASVATQLLLGPVARGTSVSLKPAQPQPVGGPK
ncbi:mammalian cell entry protein [Mycobacterium sp. 1165196.3]|uniref:MlaD family protein n=1 Tax=unclassified Mycobacterium TaxID=2642494 RepID=UPI000801D3DD|nr:MULTISPECIES: MCE family protein [unclassified Mycobacterium]OBJ26076.1 mammalian cell entry protein [Mycobacterium sp. 1245801.1]OBK35239.1 mammalian cell entry protein [Mycobacterium sp. 1165196.3]OBL01412.1 mammalian cell entry protein [Mycobacterium sp. 1245499.0]